MQVALAPSPRRTILAGVALLAALALAAAGPIAQWDDYHAFADTQAWLGIANAVNVLSNLPFAAVGLWGLLRLQVRSRDAPDGAGALVAWRSFAAALVLTAAGSAYYHLAPSNDRLVFDRLPIAFACASVTCAFLAERIDRRWASPAAVGAALLAAAAAVGWWWLTEQSGRGDLRPYLYVQFLPMLLVALALLMRLRPRLPGAVPDRAWWTVLACYAIAKIAEGADLALLDATAIVSGHTVKHLLAAAGAAALFAVTTDSRR